MNKELFKYYKVFRTTKMISEDLRAIRKINNLITKFKNTEKDKYKKEIINILIMTGNLIHVNKEFLTLIKDNIIEKDKHEDFDNIIGELIST